MTDREHEILERRAQGHSTVSIVARLHISNKTVRDHARHTFTKLAVAGRPGDRPGS